MGEAVSSASSSENLPLIAAISKIVLVHSHDQKTCPRRVRFTSAAVPPARLPQRYPTLGSSRRG